MSKIAARSISDGVERWGKFIRVDGEMTWPIPVGPVQWRLSNGQATREDIGFACSIMSAYFQMIIDPQKKRNRIASALRLAIKDYEKEGNNS